MEKEEIEISLFPSSERYFNFHRVAAEDIKRSEVRFEN